MLYDRQFKETLDQILNMIGPGGGQIYDLTKRLARKALPSDRVFLSTHVVLPDISDEKHQAAVIQFVSDIFDGDCDSIDYVLKTLAAMCGGHTSDELFHVMIGSGTNGKSKL